MKKIVCIECPNGCELGVTEKDGKIAVTGNKCKRGEKFAVAEMTNPQRTICSTVKTAFSDVPVVPVRVSGEIPKARIFDIMNEINSVTVTQRIGRGDKVIENVLGLGADIIVTSDILKKSQ